MSGSTGCSFARNWKGSTLTIAFWNSSRRDPQTYVGECSNGIFSLLKKEYDTPQNRALSAAAR